MSSVKDPRPQMVEIAHLLYDRYLTNSAGGNLSCRVGDYIYISPRYLGSKHQWQLREEMILVFDKEFNIVEGDPSRVSRESRMHFGCYRNFPRINGVIHGHPRYLHVFAAAEKPLPPASQYSRKYGTIEVLPDIPATSPELAEAVVARLKEKEAMLEKNGAGLILAHHGVVTVGWDLADAYDVLERLEWSAHTLLMMPALR
jgi:L-fuculose-phosphate aldolase